MMPNAKTFVKACLGKVGCGRAVVEGYWAHSIMRALLKSLPEGTVNRILTNSIRTEAELLKKKGS